MVHPFMKSHLIDSKNLWYCSKGPMVQPFIKSLMIESVNLWFWFKGPMVQPFMKSQMIESENFWFWSKGSMVQPFMKSHLIESDNFWFWSKGPKIHPFLKCHLTESVDFFIWLSRFPSYWIYQAGVEEPKPHFIIAWPYKHPSKSLQSGIGLNSAPFCTLNQKLIWSGVSNGTGQWNFSGQRDRNSIIVPGQRDNGTS